MENKKVTLMDIAKEAGVSLATVSYVVNNRTDIKVAAETRKKILQLCNLRQYTPSQIAKSLATGKNNIIGIQFNLLPCAKSCNLEVMELVKALQITLQSHNYDTLIMPQIKAQEMRLQRNIDGIICINMSEKDFIELKENYFVPIILVDMIIEDPLFFKVYDDLDEIMLKSKKLLNAEKVNVITEKRDNNSVLENIKKQNTNDNFFEISDFNGLIEIVKSKPHEFFIFHGVIPLISCLPYVDAEKAIVICDDVSSSFVPNNIKTLNICVNEKSNIIVDMLIHAIDRTIEIPHETKISPN